ncbi:MAG: IPT/TIG domain-containing protein [Vicinamibacterales bacterium]
MQNWWNVGRVACRALAGASFVVWTAAVASAQPVELRIPDETVSPGGVLQAKLEVTEPRPIQTGGGGMSFDGYADFLGLAVQSASGDAAAVGVMRGSTLRVRIVSPTSGLGSLPDYPILATTLRVPQAPPASAVLDMSNATLTGPGGVVLATLVKPGVVTVAPGAFIDNVSPGSATVPAGGTIHITGSGFDAANTKVKFKNASVTIDSINATTIVVRPDRAVQMHGEEIQVEIPATGQKLTYYSYQRTVPYYQSRHPLIGAVEPAFPRQPWTSARVSFAAPTPNDAYGVALQNENDTPSQVSISLVTPAAALGPLPFLLPSNARVVVSVSEIFGAACGGGCAVRVTASVPIHVLGLAGDLAADVVQPVLPGPDVVTVLDLAPALNAATFRTGQLFHLTGQLTPGVAPVAVDAYVVLQAPTGELWSLTPSGLVRGIAPRLPGLVVATSTVLDLVQTPLPPGVAPGRYQWLTALTAPGTLSLLAPIRAVAFDVLP